MSDLVTRASRSVRRRWTHARSNAHIRRLNRQIAARAPKPAQQAAYTQPVIFFNASTRLAGLSLNAAYQMIAGWAVRLAGVPVIHFAPRHGMQPCVLGTNRDAPTEPPPCEACIHQSEAIYAHSDTRWFTYQEDPALREAVANCDVDALMGFTYEEIPLGALVLPSMRWILRRHHLKDDEPTRYLYRQYILSAYNISREFGKLLNETNPRAVVVFNGMFYPEATARWMAWNRAPGGEPLRVISHEVGLRPFTAFFTPGDATAYPISMPERFTLTAEQEAKLDAYLERRMQGNFSMAGVRFWPEMRRLDDDFIRKIQSYQQVVPVFTNVIFDTSQPHSNVVFPHMFAWLDGMLDLARRTPDTLFVLRAHPDEAREGKQSRESVAEWVQQRNATAIPNVVFVDPKQYLSSYELIERSKFVMVYNSTIGLEASLMGAAVLCAGRARFTQIPTVFFPPTQEDHWRQAEEFLRAETIEIPETFRQNARRFLYYQLYRTALPFDSFLEEDGIWNGYVKVKDLDASDFDPLNSPVLQTIVDGILHEGDFLLDT